LDSREAERDSVKKNGIETNQAQSDSQKKETRCLMRDDQPDLSTQLPNLSCFKKRYRFSVAKQPVCPIAVILICKL
jgi:hypothetical protein